MKQKSSILTTLLIFQLLFLLELFADASEHFSRFPGLSELASPNGRYLLQNVDIEENEEYNHKLILRDTKTNTNKEIYSYGRYVDILWSKDSKGLIINDHGGSDYANCIMFQFKKEIKMYDVKELLTNRAIKYKKSIVGNHHVYIEGVEWITNNKIKVHVTGYGEVDPDGFSMWYEYTMGNKLRFISMESQNSSAP